MKRGPPPPSSLGPTARGACRRALLACALSRTLYTSTAVAVHKNWYEAPPELIPRTGDRAWALQGSFHAPFAGAPPPARRVQRRPPRSGQAFLQAERQSETGGKVLFLVVTDSQFYSKRLKFILETWAKDVLPDNFMAIGDAPSVGQGLADGHVFPTDCPPHSHEGACCKWGYAVRYAYRRMTSDPSIGWVYVADDDAYLRPFEIGKALVEEDPPEDGAAGLVLGYIGCGTGEYTGGICGGGGYGASRDAILAAVAGNETAFQEELMADCEKCNGWGDASISQVYKARHTELRRLYGLYGWMLNKTKFDASLADTEQTPLLYHYVPFEEQMLGLHALFTGENITESPSVPEEESRVCASFHGRRECWESESPMVTPWVQDGQDPLDWTLFSKASE